MRFMRSKSASQFGKKGLASLVGLAAVALFATAAPTAWAQDFKLAMSSPPTSLDPHFYNLFPNLNVADHVFETMVTMNPDSQVTPALAESWTLVNNAANARPTSPFLPNCEADFKRMKRIYGLHQVKVNLFITSNPTL